MRRLKADWVTVPFRPPGVLGFLAETLHSAGGEGEAHSGGGHGPCSWIEDRGSTAPARSQPSAQCSRSHEQAAIAFRVTRSVQRLYGNSKEQAEWQALTDRTSPSNLRLAG